MALTHTPDPMWPTRWCPDPTRPTRRGPDPNQPTRQAIFFENWPTWTLSVGRPGPCRSADMDPVGRPTWTLSVGRHGPCRSADSANAVFTHTGRDKALFQIIHIQYQCALHAAKSDGGKVLRHALYLVVHQIQVGTDCSVATSLGQWNA